MLEILFLVFMCKRLGKMMRAKNRKPILLQVLLAVGWFFAEFICAFLFAVIQTITTHTAPDGLTAGVYIAGFGGALLTAGIIFLIASMLKPKPAPLDPAAAAFPVQTVTASRVPPIY